MQHASTQTANASAGSLSWLTKLHSIKLGGGSDKVKLKRRDLSFILGNLATLVENGVSLPKALATLAQERSLQRFSGLIDTLRRKVEMGESFSTALGAYPDTFNSLIVNQIRVGERSGTIGETLLRITTQLEQANQLRAKIIKRLSYPMIVVVAGMLVITFMLVFIIPVFEETYNKARLPLPTSTKILIAAGDAVTKYGLAFPAVAFAVVIGYTRLRRNPMLAYKMDRIVLRLPILGEWLRDVAVLQFTEVLHTMMESGFKLIDALAVSTDSIGNCAVRRSVQRLQEAIRRGERLSRELDRHGDMFPPVVSQLVIVGEQTGKLSKATGHIREHLRKQIERKAELAVATIEPFLTIGMAVGIGLILLAIYTPMFGMVDVVDTSGP